MKIPTLVPLADLIHRHALISILIIFPNITLADSTPEISKDGSNVYMPDFSYAGYHNSNESLIKNNSSKIINVTDYGVIVNDGKDDTSAVMQALTYAHAVEGPVTVLFPKGRLVLKDILKIERSNITLSGKGMGKNGTELYFPMPLSIIDKTPTLDELRHYLKRHNKKQRNPDIYIDTYFSEYSWSGGVIWIQKPGTRAVEYLTEYDKPVSIISAIKEGRRGERFLQVDNADKLTKGDVLRIDWHNQNGKQGEILKSIYGNTELDIGSHHWTFPARSLVLQVTQIKSINKNHIEISDPLLHDINEKIPAHFSHWNHLEEVGINGLSIVFPDGETYGHHVEQGFNGIYMTSVFNGWIKDVSFSNADSAILSENSANVTISNIHSYGSRIGHYGIHLGSVHNFLVEDAKIFNPTIHTFSMNTKATKNVFLRGEGFEQPTLDQHGGANHQNLYDNMTFHIDVQVEDTGPYYDLWYGGGAKYWQPGHGRYNTTWNSRVLVKSGAGDQEIVRILGRTEGPDARVVGIYGNRTFNVDYFPSPYLSNINQKLKIPSLYEYQKTQRLKNQK